VPKADVVAVNPTHYAVALRYDAKNMKAPRVVAKGADLIAFQIRRVAEAHKVPIFEHPQLTRALYHTSEIGKEISPRLYVAVAQVLTYVYQLTGRTKMKRGRTSSPSPSSPPSPPSPSAARSRPVPPVLDIDPALTEPTRGKPRAGVRA
jgi:flagellar biosynthetic protein FlhB